MSQYDVFENNGRLKKIIPYILDIQSDLVSMGLGTRIVVPLYKANLIHKAALKLHVPASIKGIKLLAIFDELSSVEAQKLSSKITNLSASHGDLFKSALDVLFFNMP